MPSARSVRNLRARRMPATDYEPAGNFRVFSVEPSAMSAAHSHPEIELNFLLSGRMIYRHNGLQRVVKHGRLALFWAGVPHQALALEAGSRGVWIFLPLVFLLQWKLPRDLTGRLLQGEFIEVETASELPLRWLADSGSGDAERGVTLQLELQALLRRIALTHRPAPSRSEPAQSPAQSSGDEHVARVSAYLAQHFHEPELTAEAVARFARLHPKYLMKVFKKHCHMSLWEYILRLRVSHAQRLLVTSDLRVLDVALESGFGSVAPFYRAFTRYGGGRHPLAFRREQRQATPFR